MGRSRPGSALCHHPHRLHAVARHTRCRPRPAQPLRGRQQPRLHGRRAPLPHQRKALSRHIHYGLCQREPRLPLCPLRGRSQLLWKHSRADVPRSRRRRRRQPVLPGHQPAHAQRARPEQHPAHQPRRGLRVAVAAHLRGRHDGPGVPHPVPCPRQLLCYAREQSLPHEVQRREEPPCDEGRKQRVAHQVQEIRAHQQLPRQDAHAQPRGVVHVAACPDAMDTLEPGGGPHRQRLLLGHLYPGRRCLGRQQAHQHHRDDGVGPGRRVHHRRLLRRGGQQRRP